MVVVLDTDVVLSALLSAGGASRQLLLRVVDGRLPAVLSVPLLLEYEAVLKRPENLSAAGLSVDDVEVVLNQLAAAMTPVALYFLWRPAVRDPADDMVLETAVNGGADVIVSFNRKDFGTAPERFGIEVLLPRDAWRRV